MHIKRIHEMIEKLTECAKAELDRGVEQVDVEEFGAVADIIKDLCEAEKSAKIVKQMEESEEEEKKSDEYFLRILKEEYGEDDGKRYYDNYRYANGRFAPKGRGTYWSRSGSSRRGYEEMPYMYMMEGSPEWYRDIDRQTMNRMYYSGGSGNGSSGSSSGGTSGNSGSPGSSAGSSMGYSDGESRGYSDGNSRGYNDGYSRGYNEGRSSGSRNGNESRSERARRSYSETKEMHKGNNASDKQANMQSLEEYTKELSSDLMDMVKEMSVEEKNLLKNKITTLANKL